MTRSPPPHPRTSPRSEATDPDQVSTRPADSQASWFGEVESVSPLPPEAVPAVGLVTDPTAYARLYRAFLAARAALGLILVVGMATSTLFTREPSPPSQTMALAAIYAALAVVWWWWPSQRQLRGPGERVLSHRQTLATVGVDLLSFTLLSQLGGNANLNSATLMALPVLMASVLTPRFMALTTAAAATLILLSEALFHSLHGNAQGTALPAAGLTGFGLFAVALVVSELSSRLAREQISARGHLELARQQAQLNRLVIDEMPEGVLVVDRQGQVRTANPSARRLLSAIGQTASAPFQLRGVPAWEPLVRAIEDAFIGPRRLDESKEILLTFDDQTRRGLQMRLKFTRSRQQQHQDDVCVVFLEDLRQINARIRQDKLAAMGRMSAGVAHEIRNPLAAIAQANALMAEDATGPTQQKLTAMVADNVERLKRIVDDILAVAPGARPQAPAIDVDLALRSLIDEWLGLHPEVRASQRLKLDTHGLPPRELGQPTLVRFEPEHLRRIMVNLLDNALRHGSQQAEAVRVEAQWLSGTGQAAQVMISVFSDGPPIEPEVERSLFEPFFSTRSRGTGLGLYICKELCEQHGASIDYRSHPPTQRHRNEFYILMPVDLPSSPAQP